MTSHAKIHFEDPPIRQQKTEKRSRHQQIAAKLRKRPGEWAWIGTYKNGASMSATAYHIRRGNIAAYVPEGSFEAIGRTVDGKHGVWARYVGEGGATA